MGRWALQTGGQTLQRPCGKNGRNKTWARWPERQGEVLALRALEREEQDCPHSHAPH